MVAVEVAFAFVNVLIKRATDEGMPAPVFITYRFTAAAIFLATGAHFLERKTRPKLTFRIVCNIFFSALFGALWARVSAMWSCPGVPRDEDPFLLQPLVLLFR
ncbi:hypothetical protein H6P81_008306 [Aristolochia fimbriata]|uniref:WAT1-related protein n=1 Tax=Aristolochia fimbriata TaxID=158543 RepID=A0AAV7F6I9_ARIFI|nr:hypothetical protein H6P81_008306 [Aristolochia fimbriata]